MDRIILSVGTGKAPKQRARAEQLLCRILPFAPPGSYLTRGSDHIGIALRGPALPQRSSPNVRLWDEVH